jgi:diacylglycerol kinase
MKQLSNFLNCFKHAFRGICSGFKERNMIFHGLVATLVVSIGFLIQLTKTEWYIVLIFMALVLSAELFNTAIEELADIARYENNLKFNATKRIRDLSAGAVLVISMAATIVGGWIFLSKVFELISC